MIKKKLVIKYLYQRVWIEPDDLDEQGNIQFFEKYDTPFPEYQVDGDQVKSLLKIRIRFDYPEDSHAWSCSPKWRSILDSHIRIFANWSVFNHFQLICRPSSGLPIMCLLL